MHSACGMQPVHPDCTSVRPPNIPRREAVLLRIVEDVREEGVRIEGIHMHVLVALPQSSNARGQSSVPGVDPGVVPDEARARADDRPARSHAWRIVEDQEMAGATGVQWLDSIRE